MTTVLQCEEDLSFVELEAGSNDEVLSQIAQRALRVGCVRPSFEAALVERERSYPTGLPTPIPVAVPHADPEHVLRPGIGMALLTEPVAFGEMGNAASTVAARAVATLFITSPEAHVETLQALVAVFQQAEWYARASAADTAAELAATMNDLLASAQS